MTRPSSSQSESLLALMIALGALPTPNLVATAARLLCPATPANEKIKLRFRKQLSGAFAIHALFSYRSSVISVNERRERIGTEIHHRFNIYQQARERQPEIADRVLDEAIDLRGQQETLFHFISICGFKFHQLLPLAARAAGHKVPTTDMQVLKGYEHLRHYYEHIDDHYPGRDNSETSVQEFDDGINWTVRMGLPRDEFERLLVRQARAPFTIWTVDVSRTGIDTMVEIVDRNLEDIRASALTLVRNHYLAHPWGIPSPDEIGTDPLVKMNMWDPE